MTTARWLQGPEGLSAKALSIWRYYAIGLSREGWLTPENAEGFATLCELLVLQRALAGEIEDYGVAAGDPGGSRRLNPAVPALLQTTRQAAPLLAQFHLGPEA